MNGGNNGNETGQAQPHPTKNTKAKVKDQHTDKGLGQTHRRSFRTNRDKGSGKRFRTNTQGKVQDKHRNRGLGQTQTKVQEKDSGQTQEKVHDKHTNRGLNKHTEVQDKHKQRFRTNTDKGSGQTHKERYRANTQTEV